MLKIKFALKEATALERIGRVENINLDPLFYKSLFEKCNNDLRRSLNVLQAIKPLKTYDIDDVTGVIKENIVVEFIKTDIQNFKEFVQNFIGSGMSVLQLIIQLSKHIGNGTLFSGSDTKLCELAKILSECEAKCLNGVSDELVIKYMVLNYISIFSNK